MYTMNIMCQIVNTIISRMTVSQLVQNEMNSGIY